MKSLRRNCRFLSPTNHIKTSINDVSLTYINRSFPKRQIVDRKKIARDDKWKRFSTHRFESNIFFLLSKDKNVPTDQLFVTQFLMIE